MLRHRSERDLKRAVAGLARLHPDDVQAILGALGRDERTRVERLVAGVADPETVRTNSGDRQAPTYEGVSSWLLARLDPEAKVSARARREFVLMTDASREALLRAAEPVRNPATAASGRPRAQSLLGQAWRFLTGATT